MAEKPLSIIWEVAMHFFHMLATESQLQQYLSLKYDEFLNKEEDARITCTLTIAAKEVHGTAEV